MNSSFLPRAGIRTWTQPFHSEESVARRLKRRDTLEMTSTRKSWSYSNRQSHPGLAAILIISKMTSSGRQSSDLMMVEGKDPFGVVGVFEHVVNLFGTLMVVRHGTGRRI